LVRVDRLEGSSRFFLFKGQAVLKIFLMRYKHALRNRREQGLTNLNLEVNALLITLPGMLSIGLHPFLSVSFLSTASALVSSERRNCSLFANTSFIIIGLLYNSTHHQYISASPCFVFRL
jgi:hypothetical protein